MRPESQNQQPEVIQPNSQTMIPSPATNSNDTPMPTVSVMPATISSPANSQPAIASSNNKTLQYVGFGFIGIGILLSITIILSVIGIPLIIVGVILLAVVKGKKQETQDASEIAGLAATLGLTAQAKPDLKSNFDQSIIKWAARDRMQINNMLYATPTNVFFQCMFYVQHSSGGFQNSSAPTYAAVRKTACPNISADFVLSATSSQLTPFFDTDKLFAYQLEGDVSSYFTLHFTDGGQDEVLALLAPDVLQWLMTNAASASVIVKSQMMYLFIPVNPDLTVVPPNPTSYQFQYEATDKIMNYLLSKLPQA